ncbi:hypothetical protein [Streptomyces sp. NPDC001770]
MRTPFRQVTGLLLVSRMVAAALVRSELRARAMAVVIGSLTAATALGVPLLFLYGPGGVLGNLASGYTTDR